MRWLCNKKEMDLSRARVMGIVNVTPDSFSDGGLYYTPHEAMKRVKNCIRAGADIVDIGGESTRPGCEMLPWQEEWARIETICVEAVQLCAAEKKNPFFISVDTYHAETARAALAAGVDIINCVKEPSEAMVDVWRESACGIILPTSARALSKSILPDRVVVDPLVGFHATREEDLAILQNLAAGTKWNRPLCVGVSRKRLIKALTGERHTGKSLGGSLAAAVWCVANGAKIVRVHDVAETVQALRVWEALNQARPDEGREVAA